MFTQTPPRHGTSKHISHTVQEHHHNVAMILLHGVVPSMCHSASRGQELGRCSRFTIPCGHPHFTEHKNTFRTFVSVPNTMHATRRGTFNACALPLCVQPNVCWTAIARVVRSPTVIALLLFGAAQALILSTKPQHINNERCKVLCHRFGMRALGPHFAQIHNPTQCVGQCDRTYPVMPAVPKVHGSKGQPQGPQPVKR